MLYFRDTELRSSVGSLTYVSHSGRRTPRRKLAAYPAVNSPDDRCQHDERLLERRWISSREDGQQMLKLHRHNLGRADAAPTHPEAPGNPRWPEPTDGRA
jgi:hypothetical protein